MRVFGFFGLLTAVLTKSAYAHDVATGAVEIDIAGNFYCAFLGQLIAPFHVYETTVVLVQVVDLEWSFHYPVKSLTWTSEYVADDQKYYTVTIDAEFEENGDDDFSCCKAEIAWSFWLDVADPHAWVPSAGPQINVVCDPPTDGSSTCSVRQRGEIDNCHRAGQFDVDFGPAYQEWLKTYIRLRTWTAI
ncbi:uncharacterized protein L969DRAFT_95039 [Mixia osmundae IAM 14324]|uniref:Uncharacterized protein n=1 Tax=Mixia osmundae (strain CBS 9802 / IAM 14324 / JCM 22182 / KY 12970) TaxID=764103 RepID=G7E0Y6_MIXOS|nr:uncharacterized protein L969DRAFT_95039 [Mixia osmundae IAM 14324]KEI38869.1 hypothetical protein L969DRAFT_95039 [Mixia osmundae IAM 14324]GAA96496.1 hypothetical protein E5Q_03164 [Mixia osmundae IAM 14324]